MKTGRAYDAPRRADPAKVEIPPYYPDVPAVREDWASYLDDATDLDRKIRGARAAGGGWARGQHGGYIHGRSRRVARAGKAMVL